MLYKFVLTGILIFSGLVINDLIQSTGKAEMNLSFHFKSPAVDFWEPHNKKEAAVDTAALKQSNWYAQAMQGVSEKEYEINYDAAAKSYTSPNRKHNLRSLFTAKTFILQPRNDSADKWKLSLSLKGIYAGKQEVYAPVNNAAVTRSGKTIRFNHNNNFTVEYINSEEGVRQNFIIQKSLASQPKIINIKLKTNSNWFVNKVNDKEIHFAKAKKDDYDKKITYNGLKVWDATNKELNARFDVVKNDISISVNTANAIYPITIDPLSTTPAAIVESNQTNAQMGFSVASAGDVNGDGYSDVIVGTPFYDNGQSFEGAAFVFHGSLTGISITPTAIVESN